MTPLAWMDGCVLPLGEARIALEDPGFLFGDGVFESLRVRRGRPFRWDLHARRLSEGLEVVGIDAGALNLAQFAVSALAARTNDDCNEDAALRVQVTRNPAGAGRVSALLRPLSQYPERLYRGGARLAVANGKRDPDDPLCRVKSLSFLPALHARRAAQARGFDDALILNRHGRVCEASFANVIARHGKILYAPGAGEGALDGVTRRVLLDSLGSDNYGLQTRLRQSELGAADEVILASTYAGVLPVASIEGVRTSYAGPTGELTRLLTQRYSVLLDGDATA